MFDYEKPNYDLLRRFSRLAVINVLSNLTEPLAGLIGIAFLGHLTEIRYLAGVSLATVLFSYIYENLLFLRISTNAVTSQAVGRNDREAMLLAGLRNGFIALVLSVLILILQYPIGALGFSLLNGSIEVESIGLAYFNARIWGTPAVLLNFVFIGWFLGQEQSGKVLLLTVVGNVVNVVLNYFSIVQWDLGSMGAGISQAFSEYLMLLVGVVLASRSIQWQELRTAVRQFWDWSAFKNTFILNKDLLINSLVYMSIWTIFINLSATLGTDVLAENTLLQQVIFLIAFFIEGIGFTTETLTGNFQGQSTKNQLLPLLQIAIFTSLLVAVAASALCILLPETVFGLLTNHAEVIDPIKNYVPWLVPILICFSIAWILEGYFAGLGKGQFLRYAAFTAILLGFTPVAVWAWSAHSNHLLWLAVSAFMATRMVVLGIQLPKTFESNSPAAILNLKN
ncbi:MATE family efflux transporter [Hassallia byssoidea VB512170]|uniref:MATE family efflux transporter n=1 Tax=Hassallia byssoidea VB512170 TaxID=1304833 RepID=A0A846H295_9CYAN|nr:guanitoxin biosynthesis MATE family efflux transporter GntT [Hassalia byssoidea]NEU71268.1 MATE family efflux transporter [Hassalia byssoidea VB512170]